MNIPTQQRFWLKLKAQKGRDWRRPLIGVIALSIVLLAATWSMTWHWLDNEQALLEKSSRAHQESLAIIISENFNQVLDRAKFFSLASSEWFDGNPGDAAKRLSAMRSANQVFLRIALYDKTARRVYASSPDTDSHLLTSAIHERLASSVANSNLQLVPWADPLAKAWQLQLLLPITGKDSEARGVLLVVLDLGYILGLYRDVDIGRTGAIQILQSNGKEVARARLGGLEFTQGDWQTSRVLPNGGTQGSVLADYFEDGKSYLASYKHLSQYPFLVVVSREVLWRSRKLTHQCSLELTH